MVVAGRRDGGVAAWQGSGCWGKYAVDGVVGAVGMVRMVGVVRWRRVEGGEDVRVVKVVWVVGWWGGGVVGAGRWGQHAVGGSAKVETVARRWRPCASGCG